MAPQWTLTGLLWGSSAFTALMLPVPLHIVGMQPDPCELLSFVEELYEDRVAYFV